MTSAQKKLPGSVLYVCNLNAVRSPMAEAITKSLYGDRIYIGSAGLEPAERDPFAITVMVETGINMVGDRPLALDAVDIGSFDRVICLTEEARARVAERTRGQAVEIEFWPTIDPFAAGERGTREQRLEAYRKVRDELRHMIEEHFGACEKAVG